MDNLFKGLKPILARHPNAQSRLRRSAFFTAAARYAVKTNTSFEFRMGEIKDDIGGRCSPFSPRSIEMFWTPASRAHKVVGAAVHEINHMSQLDPIPELLGWNDLGADIYKTISSKRYSLNEVYRLPSAIDFAVLFMALEINSYTYGNLAERQIGCVLANKVPRKYGQHEVIGAAASAILGGRLDNYIGMYVDGQNRELDMLDKIKLEYGAVPLILPQKISTKAIVNAAGIFWNELGLKSPLVATFDTKERLFEKELRRIIKNSRGFAELEARSKRLYLNPRQMRAKQMRCANG